MSTLPQNDPINPRQLNRTQQLDKPRPAGKPRVALLMEALAWGAKIETPHGTLELAWSEDGHPVLAQALSVYRNGRTDGVPDETIFSQVDLTVADLLRYAEAMTFGASEDDRRRASRDLDQFAKALRALMPTRPN